MSMETSIGFSFAIALLTVLGALAMLRRRVHRIESRLKAACDLINRLQQREERRMLVELKSAGAQNGNSIASIVRESDANSTTSDADQPIRSVRIGEVCATPPDPPTLRPAFRG
jgi:hypothetical protein